MLFVTVALFVCSGSAFACVCVGESRKLSKDEVKAAIVKEFNDAAMVFAAEVLSLDTFQVKFRTITIWKGDAFLRLTMPTGAKKIGEGYVRTIELEPLAIEVSWMATEFLHRYNHPGGVNEL